MIWASGSRAKAVVLRPARVSTGRVGLCGLAHSRRLNLKESLSMYNKRWGTNMKIHTHTPKP